MAIVWERVRPIRTFESDTLQKQRGNELVRYEPQLTAKIATARQELDKNNKS